MRKRFTLISLLFVSLSLYSQDIHFSQYYASPVNLNPANIGAFNGSFRLVANYRNQWYSFLKSSSYQTFSGSIDAPILRNKLREDGLGVGLVVFNDKSGNGGLTNLTVMAGAAYHKSLDDFNKYSLSLGVQGGIVQRRVDFTKLLFEEQFDSDLGFDPNLGNGENIDRSSFIYGDFSIGLLFRGRFSDNVNAYFGGGAYHLHKPKESFLGDTENKLDARFVAHGGVDVGIGEYVTLTPGFMYLVQGTAQEVNVGLALGYKINDINAFYFGSWYRILESDALVMMAAYEISGFRVGLSYDINLSDLKLASNSQGAVEVSLIYIHGKEPERQMSPVKFCPRF